MWRYCSSHIQTWGTAHQQFSGLRARWKELVNSHPAQLTPKAAALLERINKECWLEERFLGGLVEKFWPKCCTLGAVNNLYWTQQTRLILLIQPTLRYHSVLMNAPNITLNASLIAVVLTTICRSAAFWVLDWLKQQPAAMQHFVA